MTLSEIKIGSALVGLVPSLVCTVVAVTSLGSSAVQVVFKLPEGGFGERLITENDLPSLSFATTERPWAFDGDGSNFMLACEAKRIDLAFLFDPMMAVHTSNVQPLPHQIAAVYESMLPRQPLRYVLADDPGAGKTIMAGLYIRELIMRADSRRILVVAPGSLVDQWRDELFEKFGLEFRVYSGAVDATSPEANPFENHAQLIVRLDQLARDEEDLSEGEKRPGPLQAKLLAAGWDLVIFDEAHKLAAHYFGSKLSKTARFRFAERVGAETRHLLLMTATPHNGKPEDFQLFLSLLDSDRFYGKFRDGVHAIGDTSDLMRRMVKEELVKFDGTPLFPQRKAYTVNYELSELEAALYAAVTHYVETEMGKADALEGQRKGSVGFALTSLQRRLASSPEAIYKSLKRRKERLSERLREARLNLKGRRSLAETIDLPEVPDDDDDLNAAQQESIEETLVDQATAAQSIEELDSEISSLVELEQQARAVVASNQDRKWEELSRLLQNTPEMHDESGRQRKIIIFTEHRDTLNYLQAKITNLIGKEEAIITIHGGTHRDERKRAQALFRSEKEVRVLIATDAAGEGVNLQCAHLMVNYDLPWNPNRLEQRFGRIHRIGQTETCHLWSLVAKETREGAVWHRLLDKLATECEALQGKVFNILGEVFEGESLRELLIKAIRFNDDPKTRAYLKHRIEHGFDHDNLKSLLNRNALAQETMSPDRLYKVKEEMEKAEARRLQPFFVRAFFTKALSTLGGSMLRREEGRCEITHVSTEIRERDRRITGRNRREQEPILKRYERICFEGDAIQPVERPGLSRAVLMHPGHPLMLAMTDLILERNANLLRRGAVLVDPIDDTAEPWLLFLLTHEVKSGDGTILSKRLQFIRVDRDGTASFAGWAPHLDLKPLELADRARIASLLSETWIKSDQEHRAVTLAASTLVPEHFNEVAVRRIEHVDRTLAAVHERLTKEIDFWSDREIKLKDDLRSGRDVRLPLDRVSQQLRDLAVRLENRTAELKSMRQVVNGTPIVLGGALVVPQGLLRELRGEGRAITADEAAARKRVERLAMEAVMAFERAAGNAVTDVSAAKCGWDVTSQPPAVGGVLPKPRHIEVKGRVAGADTITVTRNERIYAVNQGDKFLLAIVYVSPDDSTDGPHYLRCPFDSEPSWAEVSTNLDVRELLSRVDLRA
jgi:superfamily II DNA or RNA helicase